jgi:hypothetical protein
MTTLRRYWFAPAKCFNLAVVRIIAVATQLFLFYYLYDNYHFMMELADLPATYWDPLLIMSFLTLPFGWGARPGADVMQWIYWLSLIAGMLSLVGLATNLSLAVFAFTSIYLQAFLYSYGDYHHPEAVMMIALAVLAISPSGRVLSVDAWLRRYRSRAPVEDPLGVSSEFAGWPIKLLQWFFVLMYLSAVVSKLSAAGLDWANGFTLQYYLARDGLRWDSQLALWMSQHHDLILVGQFGVLLFQATFALAVVFPVLRWIYVPSGLMMHLMIYLTLRAPFFQWMALYAVFIPWSEVAQFLRGRLGQRQPAVQQG